MFGVWLNGKWINCRLAFICSFFFKLSVYGSWTSCVSPFLYESSLEKLNMSFPVCVLILRVWELYHLPPLQLPGHFGFALISHPRIPTGTTDLVDVILLITSTDLPFPIALSEHLVIAWNAVSLVMWLNFLYAWTQTHTINVASGWSYTETYTCRRQNTKKMRVVDHQTPFSCFLYFPGFFLSFALGKPQNKQLGNLL